MTVYIERDGNRIAAVIPYDNGRGPQVAKHVDGYRWRAQDKTWTYPLDLHTCRALRRVFGVELSIGPNLHAWARAEIEREKTLARTGGVSLDTTMKLEAVESLLPEMAQAMYARGYQTVAARWGADARRYLLADVPGLGKCLESFGALLEGNITSGRVLIVAPRTAVRSTWEPEVAKWLADLGRVFVADGARARRDEVISNFMSTDPTDRLNFLIINAEMVRWRKAQPATFSKPAVEEKIEYQQLFDIEWDAIIGDEVHKYLMRANPKSNNVSAVGHGFQKLRHMPDGMRMALTGTPMKGKPRNLWGTLHWLRPETYTSQWRWLKRYYKTVPNAYATSGETITDNLLGDAELELAQDLAPIMLRRTKDELHGINPDWAPPPKTYITAWVDLSAEERRGYRAIEKDAEIKFRGQTMNVNGLLAEMTRLKQAAGSALGIEGGVVQPRLPSAKLDWLLDDFLPSRGITGDPKQDQGENKVIIASQFTKLVNLAAETLRGKGIQCYVLTGATNDRDRAAQIKAFQETDDVRVFLLNTNAGGVSVTLDRADDVVLLDETSNPDDQLQVEDRAHRTSRTDHYVNITYVRALGTIEEEIAAGNQHKDEVQYNVMDAARGIEWAKAKYAANIS